MFSSPCPKGLKTHFQTFSPTTKSHSNNVLERAFQKEEYEDFQLEKKTHLDFKKRTLNIHHPGPNPSEKIAFLRLQSQLKLKSSWESIIEKYSQDFEEESDIIDLETGKIVKDNGFIRKTETIEFGQLYTPGKRKEDINHEINEQGKELSLFDENNDENVTISRTHDKENEENGKVDGDMNLKNKAIDRTTVISDIKNKENTEILPEDAFDNLLTSEIDLSFREQNPGLHSQNSRKRDRALESEEMNYRNIPQMNPDDTVYNQEDTCDTASERRRRLSSHTYIPITPVHMRTAYHDSHYQLCMSTGRFHRRKELRTLEARRQLMHKTVSMLQPKSLVQRFRSFGNQHHPYARRLVYSQEDEDNPYFDDSSYASVYHDGHRIPRSLEPSETTRVIYVRRKRKILPETHNSSSPLYEEYTHRPIFRDHPKSHVVYSPDIVEHASLPHIPEKDEGMVSGFEDNHFSLSEKEEENVD